MGDSRAKQARFVRQYGRCEHCGQPCEPKLLAHSECRAEAKADREHRRAALERGGGCYYARGGPCAGPLESHHVLGRRHKATVLACKHHHEIETAKQAEQRKGTRMATKGKGKGKGGAKPPTPTGKGKAGGVGDFARVLLGAVLVVTGWALVTGRLNPTLPTIDRSSAPRPRPTTPAADGGGLGVPDHLAWYAIAALTAAIAVTIARWVHAHRAAVRVDLAGAIAKHTHVDPTREKVRHARRWRHPWPIGVPTIGRMKYSMLFDDADGSRARAELVATLRDRTGVPDLDVVFHQARTLVAWAPPTAGDPTTAEPDPDPEPEPVGERHPAETKLEAALLQLSAKADPHAQVLRVDPDDGKVLEIGVRYSDAVPDDEDELRARYQRKVNRKLGDRWHARWNTEANVVTLERRPPMPRRIDHPDPADIPTLVTGPHLAIPFGQGERHDVVRWDWRLAPHALVIGETGSGKTVVLRTIIYRAALAGAQIHCCDPKQTELSPLENWPNVVEVATDVEDMIDLVEAMHALMDRRNREVRAAIKAGKPRPAFPAVLLVIDEAMEWIDRVNAWWKANKERGQTGVEHPVVEKWRSIARLGRTANIHLLVGIQRPDSKKFGGEARDNYGLRIACGALSAEGARMMFGSADIGTDVPADVLGRLTVQLGKANAESAQEVQGYWSPDAHLPEGDDAKILDRLRPASVTHLARAARRAAAAELAAVVDTTPTPDVEADAGAEPPRTEAVHPDQLKPKDRVWRDGQWWVVWDTEPDPTAEDECTQIEWADPPGQPPESFYNDDWLDRQAAPARV